VFKSEHLNQLARSKVEGGLSSTFKDGLNAPISAVGVDASARRVNGLDSMRFICAFVVMPGHIGLLKRPIVWRWWFVLNHRINPLNTVLWSVICECVYYLAYPAILHVRRKLNLLIVLGGSSIVVVLLIATHMYSMNDGRWSYIALLEWAGAWSYSLYLIHPLAHSIVERLGGPLFQESRLHFVLPLVALLASYVYFLMVEHPSHQLAVRITNRYFAEIRKPLSRIQDGAIGSLR
jgi:peptidoglycan/LPS O-acetylase OafA/YrhL